MPLFQDLVNLRDGGYLAISVRATGYAIGRDTDICIYMAGYAGRSFSRSKIEDAVYFINSTYTANEFLQMQEDEEFEARDAYYRDTKSR